MSLEIINKKIASDRGKVQVILANNAAMWADSSPSAVVDSNKRDGWYYTNTAPGDKANIYFFGGVQESMALHQISSVWAKLAIDNYSSSSVLPFFIVYTKPTGVGDAGAFYHSRITYTMNANVDIGVGEEVIIHTQHSPNISYDNRFISCPNKTVQGDGLGTEEVLYITIHTDSGAAAGDVKILFQNLGFVSTAGHARDVHLVGYESGAAAVEYPTEVGTGILLTTESNRRVVTSEVVSIADNSTGYSSSVENIHPSAGRISIWGNSDTQNTDIEVQYSSDDATWYNASNHYVSFHGGSNGDFAIDFETTARYIRVSQFNNHGSSRTLNVNISLA